MENLKNYTTEQLLTIYQDLFEMNRAGAEEDYLAEFEANYSTDVVFPETPTKENVVTGLGRLIAELIDDTGDTALVYGWVEQVSGDTTFHDEFLKAIEELREAKRR